MQDLLNSLIEVAVQHKGKNLLLFDVRKNSSVTDYFLLIEGNVPQHIKALKSYLILEGEKRAHSPLRIEEDQYAEWIAIDYFSLMIHIITKEVREYYHLEDFWRKQGQCIEWPVAKTVPLKCI